MNLLTLGNELPHLHTHIIPRYDRDPSPGRPFPFPATANVPKIPEDDFRASVEALRALSSS